MTDAEIEEARRPGRPRSAEVDQAIVAATVALFIELGYDGFSVEGVAARAGVSKATIYRRYPGKVELLLEAAAEIGRSVKGPIPDTGTLRGDLQALGRGYRRLLEDSDAGRAIPAMIVARRRDPELDHAHRGFIAERRAEAAGIVRRGVERGELPSDTDVDLVVDLVAGPLFYRILINGDELDDRYVDRLVDTVLQAFSA
jgi:AcrR family transcriptional regulator